tara:strand:- start:308 stop:1087 length:780 start_codon:yes stop_codon:yes gene_type:complete
MRKTLKKGDLLEYMKQEDIIDEEELTELIDTDGSLIDSGDNFRSTDNIVKSKGTSQDYARRTAQGPGAYFAWGGAYYGSYHGMNEEEEMDVRDEDDDLEMWNKPDRNMPSEYTEMDIEPKIDDEGRRDHDDYPDKRKDNYQGFFEEDLKGIAENRMESLVDEMLQKKQKGRDVVRRTNKTDLMHDVEIPDFTELKSTYEKPIVARKVMHLTDLIIKQAIGGTEMSMIFNYMLDTLDLSKLSDEQKEYLGDKLKYGEEGE